MSSILVPPLNFSLVSKGVYRSGYPNPKNYPFLRQLRLASIIYLGSYVDLMQHHGQAYLDFMHANGIRFYHFSMLGNKEPFQQMNPDDILRVLLILHGYPVVDPDTSQVLTRHHPVLVHCNKGKHRVGCIVGILRKLQEWSLSSIFDEYRRFAGLKGRIADQDYIEAYDIQPIWNVLQGRSQQTIQVPTVGEDSIGEVADDGEDS